MIDIHVCLLAVSFWLCGTSSVQADGVVEAQLDDQADQRFPPSAYVMDVTASLYGAKGDGITDDTAALQKALNDMMGLHKVLYLPNGTYLFSATLNWSNTNTAQQPAWGFNWLQGQNPRKTIIRLKDKTFTDSKNPKAIMWCGGFGSADWFHNYIQGVTFNIGRDNPGAIGLQFYSNNIGGGAKRCCDVTRWQGRGWPGFGPPRYQWSPSGPECGGARLRHRYPHRPRGE